MCYSKCESCGFHDPKSLVCQLTGSPNWEPHDFCSKHKPKVQITYNNCKKPICNSCFWDSHCAFDEDTTMSKTIQQQKQTGTQIFITEIRNPELEKKTCHECKCYDHESSVCFRNCGNYCKNYTNYEKEI